MYDSYRSKIDYLNKIYFETTCYTTQSTRAWTTPQTLKCSTTSKTAFHDCYFSVMAMDIMDMGYFFNR